MKTGTLKKILKRIKPDDKIEVKWQDHFSGIGWDVIKKNQVVYCFSVGYYHSYDNIYLYMMSSITPGNTGGVMGRIKSDIIKIRKLKP